MVICYVLTVPRHEGRCLMVQIVKKKGENNETLFRKFTRAVVDEKIQDDVRESLFYIKPSQIRKEKEKNRKKRRRRHN
ncbi:MAG: 30S ribosomal protein S21 [Patescibacteria group bacterium]|nr:30S ribosomal protein S21 [Patescibacteria group bacterium]